MATSSTSASLSNNPVLELLPKLRPLEPSNYEACFSKGNLTSEYDDCVSTNLQILAAKDKKLREILPILEAQKRVKSAMGTFLKEKAEKVRKSENDESEDSEQSDEEIPVPVFVPLVLQPIKAVMTNLEVRSFIFKLWLRRIQLIREQDAEKCKGLQDFEHAIFDAQEVTDDYKEFIYKQFHDRELQQMLPDYDERQKKAWVGVLEEKEKAGFEMLEEDLERFCSNTARFCALLGLQLDFLDRLEEIPPEDRDHSTLRDWIVAFLQNNYESVGLTNRSSPTKELLASIGFDPLGSAVETIMARAESALEHIDVCDMAEIFIKDEFKYNLLLSPEVPRFPLLGNLANIWFQLPEKAEDEGNDEDHVCHVNIINLVIEKSHASRITRSTLSDLVSEDDQNVVLFHGTDHQSAYDILFRGIDLCQGRQKRDFSCGSGFYLTDKSDEALKWAQSTTAKPALLAFQINRRQYLNDAKKLNLFENEQRWREIVSSFRSGKRTAKTRKSLSAYDLIEGPLGTMRGNEPTEGEIEFDSKPSSYQMCLISDDFADSFRETLHSIMFLEIS